MQPGPYQRYCVGFFARMTGVIHAHLLPAANHALFKTQLHLKVWFSSSQPCSSRTPSARRIWRSENCCLRSPHAYVCVNDLCLLIAFGWSRGHPVHRRQQFEAKRGFEIHQRAWKPSQSAHEFPGWSSRNRRWAFFYSACYKLEFLCSERRIHHCRNRLRDDPSTLPLETCRRF